MGSRPVDPAELMQPQVGIHGPATVVARFQQQEGAKLALERLVREIPLDRRVASIRRGDDGATLEVVAPGADTERIAQMLRKYGGQGC